MNTKKRNLVKVSRKVDSDRTQKLKPVQNKYLAKYVLQMHPNVSGK